LFLSCVGLIFPLLFLLRLLLFYFPFLFLLPLLSFNTSTSPLRFPFLLRARFLCSLLTPARSIHREPRQIWSGWAVFSHTGFGQTKSRQAGSKLTVRTDKVHRQNGTDWQGLGKQGPDRGVVPISFFVSSSPSACPFPFLWAFPFPYSLLFVVFHCPSPFPVPFSFYFPSPCHCSLPFPFHFLRFFALSDSTVSYPYPFVHSLFSLFFSFCCSCSNFCYLFFSRLFFPSPVPFLLAGMAGPYRIQTHRVQADRVYTDRVLKYARPIDSMPQAGRARAV